MSRFVAAAGPLLARLLLSGIFVYSGYQKLAATGRAASSIAGKGLPFASTLAQVAGVFELAVALVLVLGLKARAAALATVAYLAVVTWLFHWHPALRGDHAQMLNVLKNGAIAGRLAAARHLRARAGVHRPRVIPRRSLTTSPEGVTPRARWPWPAGASPPRRRRSGAGWCAR